MKRALVKKAPVAAAVRAIDRAVIAQSESGGLSGTAVNILPQTKPSGYVESGWRLDAWRGKCPSVPSSGGDGRKPTRV
jgi:hypothetical protein